MNTGWSAFLTKEQEKEYFKHLMQFVNKQYEVTTVFPPKELIFNAFNLTDINDVKVVIIGQDPYHGLNQANGLAFSVADGMPFPPSLRNIFKEVNIDTGAEIPFTGNLERWANQGVFLLNDVLTVEKGKPGSHQRMGWEMFTDNVISHISNHTKNTVFLLWGNYAHKKGRKIDESKHLVLKSGHPSPMSANQGKWFNNKHFSKTNEFLIKQDKRPINW